MLELEKRSNRNSGVYFNPFREMESFCKAFDNDGLSCIKCDIRDTGDNFELEADLPGFAKENINIEISDGLMTISAERKSAKDEKSDNGKYVRYERTASSVRRSFDVSEIDTDNINAAYENGVLKLTLPKRKPETPATKKLEIK